MLMERNALPAGLGPVFRVAIIGAGLVIIFFSGIFPLEEYLARVPAQDLSASVAAADVAALTNENRTERGLPALSVNPLLAKAAQLKAEDMAENSYYAHISPDGKSPLYWLNRVGYAYLNAGENLVIDRTTSEDAVDAWMGSKDHRENILRPQFTEMGVGVAEGKYEGVRTIFVVQEFGTPYPLSIAPQPAAKQAAKPAVQKPAPAAKPAEEKEREPALLSVDPLPRPSVVTQVNVLAAPAVHALAPAAYPEPEQATLPVASSSAASTTATTTASSATSTPAETGISFVLAPEFFSPVTIAAVPDEEVSVPVQDARYSVFSRIKAYMQHISAILRRS